MQTAFNFDMLYMLHSLFQSCLDNYSDKSRQTQTTQFNVIARSRRDTREKAHESVMIGFGLASHWLTKCRAIHAAKQNKTKANRILLTLHSNPSFIATM